MSGKPIVMDPQTSLAAAQKCRIQAQMADLAGYGKQAQDWRDQAQWWESLARTALRRGHAA